MISVSVTVSLDARVCRYHQSRIRMPSPKTGIKISARINPRGLFLNIAGLLEYLTLITALLDSYFLILSALLMPSDRGRVIGVVSHSMTHVTRCEAQILLPDGSRK